VEGAVLEAEGEDTDTLALIHNQVEGKVLNEEGGVVLEGLAVKGVQKGVTSPISSGGAPESLST